MIVLGSDHGGFALKEELAAYLKEKGLEVKDMGCYSPESVDYPDVAQAACEEVKQQGCLGILLCGTGIGISISANKVPGIRAALCSDPYSARMCREHNNAQVLCLGGRVVGPELAKCIVDAFLEGSFAGGRHQRRVDKIMAIENNK
ncbi:MAG: ribose 5-phosphate isomerase B [Clostridia bacterium]|nr:ribose 5-phosphate isomerase B [Clostridia bacterium]